MADDPKRDAGRGLGGSGLPIDLGRETSQLLVEVRTVLSRAEDALSPGHHRRDVSAEPGQWISQARFVPSWAEDQGGWVRVDGHARYRPSPDEMDHPDREEIRAALEEVVRLLSPWRRTGRTRRTRRRRSVAASSGGTTKNEVSGG